MYFTSGRGRGFLSRKVTFSAGQAAVLALLLILVGVVMPLAFLRLAPRPTPSLPVSNVRIEAPTLRDRDVCPGSTHAVTMRYNVKRLATLTTLTSVTPTGSNSAISGTVSAPSYVPLFKSGSASMDSEWTVPFLAPGAYWLVSAFATYNQETQPGYIFLPFSIPPNCKGNP